MYAFNSTLNFWSNSSTLTFSTASTRLQNNKAFSFFQSKIWIFKKTMGSKSVKQINFLELCRKNQSKLPKQEMKWSNWSYVRDEEWYQKRILKKWFLIISNSFSYDYHFLKIKLSCSKGRWSCKISKYSKVTSQIRSKTRHSVRLGTISNILR